MNSKAIHQSDSIQELANFWDSHDLTDFDSQLEEVTQPVFQRDAVLQIRLQPQEVEAVKKIALSRGIDSTELIREWVLTQLRTA
ncbi:CopG family antitoxin [[Phormidium] sp. ETS-05]|uniref:CopG family antitoxin n=1 Tax=[Phormidium] sp. ETS-05 TaxID=222819 RepID=UPI0018EECCD1|nr:CopG family antitoxin [[Phormidium] sp. ETS-05]